MIDSQESDWERDQKNKKNAPQEVIRGSEKGLSRLGRIGIPEPRVERISTNTGPNRCHTPWFKRKYRVDVTESQRETCGAKLLGSTPPYFFLPVTDLVFCWEWVATLLIGLGGPGLIETAGVWPGSGQDPRVPSSTSSFISALVCHFSWIFLGRGG